jgi:hypothetical protein
MQHFRDQGETMCACAEVLTATEMLPEVAVWYQRARDVGEAHGFISVESRACLGLGHLAMADSGRQREGLDLLRNAVAAASLSETLENNIEVHALMGLTGSLFNTSRCSGLRTESGWWVEMKPEDIDEVELLIPRFREATKALSQRNGRLCAQEFHIPYFNARLHEVLFICTLSAPHGPCVSSSVKASRHELRSALRFYRRRQNLSQVPPRSSENKHTP